MYYLRHINFDEIPPYGGYKKGDVDCYFVCQKQDEQIDSTDPALMVLAKHKGDPRYYVGKPLFKRSKGGIPTTYRSFLYIPNEIAQRLPECDDMGQALKLAIKMLLNELEIAEAEQETALEQIRYQKRFARIFVGDQGKDGLSVDQAVQKLNEFLALDPLAIQDFLEVELQANENLFEHPDLACVHEQGNTFTPFDFLNALFGLNEDQSVKIVAVIGRKGVERFESQSGRIERFIENQ